MSEIEKTEEVTKNLKDHLLKIIDAIPLVIDESKNPHGCVDQSLFTQDEEIKLFICLNFVKPRVKTHVMNHEYEEALTLLSLFGSPLGPFFDNVKINVDDQSIRRNRLALVYEVVELFRLIGDFSKIEIGFKKPAI